MVKKLVVVDNNNSLPSGVKIPEASVKSIVETIVNTTPSLKGDTGKSAYETAVSLGFNGTQAAWLLSLKGQDGGLGKSAYEVAVAEGFVGSKTEWLTSLAGQPGKPGNDAVGTNGKTAYELAVAGGYVGTQTAWVASLKGSPGNPGKDGANAPGSNVLVLSTGTPVPDGTPIGTIVFYVTGDITPPAVEVTIGTPVYTTMAATSSAVNLALPSDTSKGIVAIIASQVTGDAWTLPSGWVKVFTGPSNSRALLVAYAPPGTTANTFTVPGGTATRSVATAFPVTGITGELVGSAKVDSALDAGTSTYKAATVPAVTLSKSGLGFAIATTNMSTTNTSMSGSIEATTQVGTSFTNIHVLSKGVVSVIPQDVLTVTPGMSSNYPAYHVGIA